MANPFRGEIEAELGGATRTLRLGMDELAAIESDVGMGIVAFAGHVISRRATVRQLQATLYHGLVGGGWTAKGKNARAEVQAMMGPLGIVECFRIVAELVGAALKVGQADEDEDAEGNPTAGASPAA